METPIAAKYGWKTAIAEHSHSYLLPGVLNHLRKSRVKSLLDIGTGNGAAIPIWLRENIKVAAMEPDEEGYNFARLHTSADVRNIGVGGHLPIEWKGAFDAVVCLEVVEHLFNPVELVHTAYDALDKEGIAIISTPYHGYIKNLILAIFNKWDFHHHPLRVGGHIKFWSKTTLSKLFVGEGFKEVTFEGVGRLPWVWKSMIMVFRK